MRFCLNQALSEVILWGRFKPKSGLKIFAPKGDFIKEFIFIK